jgi:hypothetical protein
MEKINLFEKGDLMTASENLLKTLRAVERYEATGRSTKVSLNDAEECVDRGWLDIDEGDYRLTDTGRRVLEEARVAERPTIH